MLTTSASTVEASRIAIVGCSYGNRRALSACLADAGSQGCGAVLAAGDMLGFCGGSGEAIEQVRDGCAVWIQGNHEREASAGSAACGCGHADPTDEALSCQASAIQIQGLEADDQTWLERLPELARVATPGGAVLLAHGSPDRQNEFLHRQGLDLARVEGWLQAADARVLAVSHSGIPWVAGLADGRLAVNCGSAGKPDHDGDPCVHYAVVDLSETAPRAWIRRVAYDHAAAAAELLVRGGEPALAEVLCTGVWTWGVSSLPPDERDRPRRGPSFAISTSTWTAA